MKVAIMQPYLFPYLGYYQLVNSVDKFVFYDDVTYIKRGYINRNHILSNGESLRFTLPVLSASQNININELYFTNEIRKILQTIQQSYGKAPFFKQVYPIIEAVFCAEERNVSILCAQSIKTVLEYLGMDKRYYFSSEMNFNRSKVPAEKLIDITKLLGGTHYVNSIGGVELYDKDFFENRNITLSFINMRDVRYFQGLTNNTFVPNLSMIDILMWNDVIQIKDMLSNYELK